MKKLVAVALLSVLFAAQAAADEIAGQYYIGAKLGDGLGVFGGCKIDQNFAEEVEYVELGSSGYYKSRAIGVSGVLLASNQTTGLLDR